MMTVLKFKIDQAHEYNEVYLFFTMLNEDWANLSVITPTGGINKYKNQFLLVDGVAYVNDPVLLKELIEGAKTAIAPAKVDKKNPHSIVRYVRPIGEDANLYGVTLVFDLDYLNRTVDVGISICNGDNFNKNIGKNLAVNGDNFINGLYMPDDMYDGSFTEGLVKWFFERSPSESSDNAQYNINWRSIELMIAMYESSSYPHQ